MAMRNSSKIMTSIAGIGFLATSVSFSAGAATGNPFAAVELPSGYALTAKDGEGKCGEGKCGEDKGGEGKCGEGKCGEDKGGEGKCGEGKCGGAG